MELTRNKFIRWSLILFSVMIALVAGIATVKSPAHVLAGILLITAGWLALFRYPFSILLLVIGIVPLTALDGLNESGSISVTKVFFAPLLIIICLQKIFNSENFKWSFQATCIVLYFCILVLSAVFSEYRAICWHVSLKHYIGIILLFFATLQLIDSRRKFKAILWTIMLSCTVSATNSLLGGGIVVGRATGLSIIDPNSWAGNILVGMFIAAGMAIHTRGMWKKLPFFVMATVCLMGIVFSDSRGAALAVMAGAVAMAFLYRKNIKPAHVLFAVATLIVVVTLFIPESYWERIQSLRDMQTDPSLIRRFSYQIIGLKLFITHPIVGVGPGISTFQYASQEFRYITDYIVTGPRFLHNMYLQILADSGLLGFFAFMLCTASTFYSFIRSSRTYERTNDNDGLFMARTIIITFSGFMFSNLFLPAIYYKYTWLHFAMASFLLSDSKEINDGMPFTTT